MTSITTEEAETLARQLDANEPMVQDPVAIEFFGDVATALRSIAAERDAAIARAEKAEAHLRGREWVKQWQESAVAARIRAEAEAEKLRDDYDKMKRSRDRYREEWQKAKDHQEVAATRARAALNQGGDDGGEKAGHSERLRKGLSGVVKSLRDRPPELRGPFKVPDLEKAKRHHHDGVPEGLLMRGD